MSIQLDYPMKSNGIYILSKVDMDVIAERLLKEYLPKALEFPQPVNIDYILKEPLALDVKFRILSRSGSVLGAITFGDVKIPVYDADGHAADEPFEDGIVIIDTQLDIPEQLRRCRFTKAHECSHRILHRTYHDPQRRAYAFRGAPPYIACRKIEIFGQANPPKMVSNWEEWQADTLAAAILMPIDMFMTATAGIFDKFGFRSFCIIERVSGHKKEIIDDLSKVFEVSHRAVELRMRQLGLITSIDITA